MINATRGALTIAAAALTALAAGCGDSSGGSAAAATTTPAAATAATPTASAASCARTVPLTEGPYFKAGSPARRNLRTAGVSGKALLLTGRVLDSSCKPIAGAVLDFWQADGNGNYDNAGYRLRGHQTAGADGSWSLTTVVPGLYPGRTEHIHVKVRRPSGAAVTSQLFFPGVSSNDGDGIFVRSMLVKHFRKSGAGYKASFTFVIGA